MSLVSLTAHFKGERVLLDEPFEIAPKARMIITLLPTESGEGRPDANISNKQAALAAIRSGNYRQPTTEQSSSEPFALAKQEEKEMEERRWTP